MNIEPARLIQQTPKILLAIAATIFSCAYYSEAIAAPAKHKEVTPAEHEIFAKVYDTTITQQDFDTAFALAARAKFYHGKPPNSEIAAMQREVGNKLINDLLLLHEAKLRKLKPDATLIKQQLDSLDQRYSNDEEWKKVRSQELPKIKTQMENKNLLVQLEKIVRKVPDPTENQLRAYYDAHLDKFTAPEQQRVSLILLKVDPSSPNEAWNNTYEEAKNLHTRLKNGENFAELAKKYSGDPSAESGGDMGYLHKGMLSEAGEQEVGKLKPGEFSEPTTMMEGIAIFQLTDRQPPKINKFENIQDRARGLWLTEQSKLAWESLIERLRKQTPVKVNEALYLPLPVAEEKPVNAK